MKENPYLKLRHQGVRGKVPEHLYSNKIYDNNGESVTIFAGMLEENAWDFGYEIHFSDGSKLSKYPGSGSGWFASKVDALLFGAAAIKIAFSVFINPVARGFLESYISSLLLPKLDL